MLNPEEHCWQMIVGITFGGRTFEGTSNFVYMVVGACDHAVAIDEGAK